MKNWILILGIFSSCINNNCTPHATCNDDTLQFGDCNNVCDSIGIKYYYDCQPDGTLIKRDCI
jgi:hypothetical protein